MKPKSLRPILAIVMIFVTLIFVGIMHLVLTEGDRAAVLLFDRRKGGMYPFSIQMVMWFSFFLGIGELLARWLETRAEARQLKCRYLPEDEFTLLQDKDLSQIYKNANHPLFKDLFLPRLIRRIIIQFKTNKEVDQANSLLNSSLEMFMHELDLNYNMLRYIVWVIPTFGFIGSVMGISHGLGAVSNGSTSSTDSNLLQKVTGELFIAFDGTFLALLMAAILVLIMNILQGREEKVLNYSGAYCLDHLINRLCKKPTN